MLKSLKDIKSNSIDVCVKVVNTLHKLLNDIVNHPYQPKFRRIYLESSTFQKDIFPYTGAIEFLFEIGFIDEGNNLVLPLSVSPSILLFYREELLSIIPTISKQNLIENSFLKEIENRSSTVLNFENAILQNKALENLPPEDIELYKNVNVSNAELNHEQMMLKLMTWFKKSFFKWFDTPTCQICRNSTKFMGINHYVLEEHFKYAEVYECIDCNFRTEFKRYGICEQLLTTRMGRCGEWADCFTLFCRALGWEARLVIDKTDHVWTEVWSIHQKRWIHCDPCETALDKPLLYEKGWGKKLSYVLAYSNEEVQDVTWRYTSNSNEVLKRRTLCTENELLSVILSLSNQRQNNVPFSRRKYLAERRLNECVEMLYKPEGINAENYGGRTSGALNWRLARGEIQSNRFIWTPTKTEIANKRFELKYSTAMDTYVHENCVLEGWQNGVYSYNKLFRKEELDWQKVYLCREENSKESTIEWQFDFSSSGLVVDNVTLIYTTTLYNNGQVEWKLVGNGVVTNLPVNDNTQEVVINQVNGTDFVTLNAYLFGGSGDLAWQHSQLFRQSLNDQDYPFKIVFILKEKKL